MKENKATGGRDMVIETLHKVLERDNSLSRCCAVKALEKLRSKDNESVERLIRCLKDSDPDVSMDAAQALGNLKIEKAVEPLLESLKSDPEGDVRVQAIIALSKIKSAKALDDLFQCIKEDGYIEFDGEGDDMEFAPAWEVQSQALDALGEIGDERAVDAVIALLKDEELEDLQEKGFRVLAKLNSDKATQFLLEQLKNGGRLARRRAAKAFVELNFIGSENGEIDLTLLEGLSNALLDEDPDVRIYAARVLGRTGSQQIIVPITMLLSDENTEVSKEAAVILGKMRGEAIVERLVKMLETPDLEVKKKIIEVLGDIGADESLSIIVGLLESPSFELQYEAVKSLGKMGAMSAVKDIARLLENEKTDKDVRVQAARSLGTILKESSQSIRENEPAATDEVAAESGNEEEEITSAPEEISPIDVLKRTAFDEREMVCISSMGALVEIDPDEAIDTLAGIMNGYVTKDVEPLEEETRETCEGSLQSSGSAVEDGFEGESDDLPVDLGNKDFALAKKEVSTLASIMAAQALKEVAESEPDYKEKGKERKESLMLVRIRSIAARLLGETKSSRAISPLKEAVAGESVEIKRESILSLGRIGGKETVPTLLEALDDENRDVRLAAIDALRLCGSVDELEDHLEKIINDPDYFVRERGVHLLGAIKGPNAAKYICQVLDDESRVVRKEALKILNREMNSEMVICRVRMIIFEEGGELRLEAAKALKRLGDLECSEMLLERLNDEEAEEYHWICIDALAELNFTENATVH